MSCHILQATQYLKGRNSTDIRSPCVPMGYQKLRLVPGYLAAAYLCRLRPQTPSIARTSLADSHVPSSAAGCPHCQSRPWD